MFWTLALCSGAIYLLIDWLICLPKVGNYDKKYIFVTGCDTGFGRDLAIRLDKMGFPVFAGCLTEQGAKSLSESCSSRLETLILNIADSASIQAAFDKVKRSLPNETSLWAVVNNAGVTGPMGAAEMLPRKSYVDTCQVNLFGPIEVCTTFMPLLRKSKGRIVNVTSIAGRFPGGCGPYCASKFGLEGFSDVFRREISHFGVKVSIIEPGHFRTPILDADKIKRSMKDVCDKSNPEVKAAYGGEEAIQRSLKLAEGLNKICSPHLYKVVDAYVAAITSLYPRPRYPVGNDAKYIFVPLSYMPEWLTDYLQRKITAMGAKNQ